MGGPVGWGQFAWWPRFAAHLRTLRLTTLGLERCRRIGLRRWISLPMAQRQMVVSPSGS